MHVYQIKYKHRMSWAWLKKICNIYLVLSMGLLIRWDKHELLNETDGIAWTEGDARDITTLTYGVQYHFARKMILAFNYIDREVTAPNENHAVVQDVVGSIKSRFSFQLTWIY